MARTNLEAVHQGLGDAGRQASAWAVHCREVVRWLAEPNQQAPFDLIYADPPYAAELYGPVASAVRDGDWLQADGSLLLECSSTALPDLAAEAFSGWDLVKQKRYGSSTVLVLKLSRPGRCRGGIGSRQPQTNR